MICPCENCICISVCKHKHYVQLFINCILLKKYLPNYQDARKRSQNRLSNLYNIIQPTTWSVVKKQDSISNLLWVRQIRN